MDPTLEKAGDVSRRTSMRASVRLSVVGDDNDGGDVNLGGMPADHLSTIEPSTASEDSASHTSGLDHTRLQPPPARSRPSSIAKPPASLSESISEAEASAVVADGDPRHVPGHGPSTIPIPASPSDASRGPAHPYGLYPQNTIPLDAGQEMPIVNEPPAAYQRRITSDLVGPLTHNEELPPYTRFPEATYPRKEAMGVDSPARAASGDEPQPAQPVPSSPAQSGQVVPGSGAPGPANRDPEYASTSDEIDSPRSRLSARSFTSDGSQREMAAGKPVSEKEEPRSWQKRARKRIWGFAPCWLVGLAAVVLVVIAVVVGAVLGSLLNKGEGSENARDESESTSSQQPIVGSDVIPLEAYPEDLPQLETGNFMIWGLTPIENPKDCLSDASQQSAWSCGYTVPGYNVSVTRDPSKPKTSAYTLDVSWNNYTMPGAPPFSWDYVWGSKRFLYNNTFPLRLVEDIYETSRGPAWWGRMTYNKTIMVPESSLRLSGKAKRNWGGPAGADSEAASGDGPGQWNGTNPWDPFGEDGEGMPMPMGPPGSMPGDKLWECTWPETALEIFIYPEKDSGGPFGDIPNSWPMPSTSSSTEATETQTQPPGSATESPTVSASVSAAETSETQDSNSRDTEAEAETEAETEAEASASTSSSSLPFPTGFPFGDMPQPPPSFPKFMKVKEGRVPELGATKAFCRQIMVLEGNRSDKPVLDSDGEPIEMELSEVLLEHDTQPSSDSRRWLTDVRGHSKRADAGEGLSKCACLSWLL